MTVEEMVNVVLARLHNPPQPSLTLREGDKIDSPLRVRGDRGVTELTMSSKFSCPDDGFSFPEIDKNLSSQ